MKYTGAAIISAVIAAFVLLLIPAESPAQGTNRGNEFWFAFPPNFHNHYDRVQNDLRYRDSLYIFIASDEPTKGKIEFFDNGQNSFSRDFEITDPDKLYKFAIRSYEYEINGINRHGDLLDPQTTFFVENEKIIKKTFRVTADDEIIVYAHSQANTTSEAMLLIPETSLGKEYLILSYPSDGNRYFDVTQGWKFSGQSTPSQFVIIGTEDDTEVRIVPSTETALNGSRIQNITMDEGEVYLVQAAFEGSNEFRDLSGTEVFADKPIGIISSHQRATVPAPHSYSSPSRDILLEQLPAVEYWGINSFLIPYVQPNPVTNAGSDIYRIMAAQNGTEVYIDGNLEGIINRGEFIQGELNRASVVEANKPILTVQYKKTSNSNSGNTSYDGDPFMMVVPTTDQWGNTYRFVNIQSMEYDGFFDSWKAFPEQYLTVVTHKTNIDTMFLDGNRIDPTSFNQIGNSDYVYGEFFMQEGIHKITAFDPFAILVYGWGWANSYGYVGGMFFNIYDLREPAVLAEDDCYKVNGRIIDSVYRDTGIENITVTQADNIRLNIEQFVPWPKSVGFEANLVNIYNDGRFSFTARDSVGNRMEYTKDVRGFTLRNLGASIPQEIYEINQRTRVGMPFEFDVEIENYGKFIQTIEAADLKMNIPEYEILTPMPLTINPGESEIITIRFVSDVTGEFIDTLIINDGCSDLATTAMKLNAINDETPPGANANADDCNREFIVNFTDSLLTDFGLKEVVIDENINCDIDIISFTYRNALVKATVVDPYRDAYFKLTAFDSLDHQTSIEREIPGYTLSFPGMGDTLALSMQEINFDREIIGAIVCDTITLRNYGAFEMVISDIKMKENEVFSLPQAQLPIILEPGESYELTLCFRPLSVLDNPQEDVLVITFNCLDKEFRLTGTGDELAFEGDSRCDVGVQLVTGSVPKKFYLDEVAPNPLADQGSVLVGIPKKTMLTMQIYDLFGNKKLDLLVNEIDKGTHKVRFDASVLPQGTYFLRMNAAGREFVRQFNIIK